jgi:hypothetical protein
MKKKRKKPAREFGSKGFVGAGERRAGRKAWLVDGLEVCPRLAAEVWISGGAAVAVVDELVKKKNCMRWLLPCDRTTTDDGKIHTPGLGCGIKSHSSYLPGGESKKRQGSSFHVWSIKGRTQYMLAYRTEYNTAQ